MIELAIFDHDMTIVDSSYAIQACFNYVARSAGLPEATHERVMEYIATPLVAFCEGVLGEYRPEWIKLYRSVMEQYERELIRPYPDTVSTLVKLRERGVKLAVVSNRERPSLALEHSGLAPYFDLIVGAEEPFGKVAYKPAPDMIALTLAHFGVEAANAVYVGDADIDIMTALNADVRGIGITTANFTREDFGKLGAWAVIGSLSEMIGIAASE